MMAHPSVRVRTRAMQVVLVAASVLAAASCGSTVSGASSALGASQQSLSGQAGFEQATGQAASSTTSQESQVTTASSATSAQDLSTAGADSTTTSAGTGGSGSTSLPRRNSPVEVGFEYATGVGAFGAALGISADIGDGQAQATAIVNYVNSHGGLAGHPIKPVFYALDLTRTDPYAQFMQEMCTMWTQDHHVVAAFAYANADYSPLATCLAKRHAIFATYENYSRAQSDWKLSPFWVETATLTAERLAPLEVQTFVEQGFFKGQKRVGLLAYDYPQAQRQSSLLVAELKRIGIATTVYAVRYGTSTPELGNTIASIQNAVLRFRSEGIQRVMSAAYPGAIAFFMRYADSQSYRPLYGLSSYDALASLLSNAPVAQMHGAIATGWWPTADFTSAQKPPLNASGKICRAVFTKAGIPATQDATSFGYCDFTLSLQAATRSNTGILLTGDVLLQGLESLGNSYISPSMLGTSLSRQHHDGVAAARPVKFDDSCSCWQPSGSVHAIP